MSSIPSCVPCTPSQSSTAYPKGCLLVAVKLERWEFRFLFALLIFSEKVAERRKNEIGAFLLGLFRLADEISHSDIVYTFFHPLHRDQKEANIHINKLKGKVNNQKSWNNLLNLFQNLKEVTSGSQVLGVSVAKLSSLCPTDKIPCWWWSTIFRTSVLLILLGWGLI